MTQLNKCDVESNLSPIGRQSDDGEASGVKGLYFWVEPNDIQVKNLLSAHWSLFADQLATWDKRMEYKLRDDLYDQNVHKSVS